MTAENVLQCADGHPAIWFRPVWRDTPEGPCRDPCPVCAMLDEMQARADEAAAEIESLNRELSRVNAEQENRP